MPEPALPAADSPAPPDASPAATPLRAAAVPQGRASRLLHLGRAVGELAAGAAAEGLGRLARGERPALADIVFTPANARRLAERLSQMRGAVMKLGQLLSMDGEGVLPPAFAALLAGLRDQAHAMPATQLDAVLSQAWGADWHQRFRRFSFQPIASASIGQVHRAETHDGRVLALKIQHPGVRESIASDVANLALLARTPGLLPAGLDLTELLDRVRQQLLRETDYVAEAAATTAYREALGDDPVLWVPAVHADHSSARILATDFVAGVPVDRLADNGSQPQRDAAATALARLAAHELFTMQLVQTDPNFGNYLVDVDGGRIALLDFGAAQAIAPQRVQQLRDLGRALRASDADAVRQAALALGYIGASEPPAQADGVLAMLMAAGEPLRQAGPYDFGASDLFRRMVDQGQAQFFDQGFSRTPPADLLLLQRKFIGTFLLCARLRARVDLAAVFAPHL
ncbi:ABC1 kinase family protein [Pseudaquabacterium pictum]|uniref:Ubiquinol-cytochrome c reductase n=1 Tax=Pseudaquabacterium pictum TaxID=2315236 RepID=A0A480AMH4_9BURK|nr:AarF/ABC1/UbiB kinase family protein [Rubrivivax pictus]GCL61950.1 ubiquinol-cytochrome c reductase [Rubrivivax pictus]